MSTKTTVSAGDIVVICENGRFPKIWNHRFGEVCKVIEGGELDGDRTCIMCPDGTILYLTNKNLRPLTKLERALR